MPKMASSTMPLRPILLNGAVLLIAGITAGGITGCAINDPYASHSTLTSHTTPVVLPDAADPAPERGGTVPTATKTAESKTAGSAGELTPRAALIRYADLYVNWSARDVVARQRQLASISLGQARAQALQAAASARSDELLIRSRVANSGQVVAIATGQGPARQEWVVVTREHTVGEGDYAGLPPTLHVTYATVVHTREGWVVNSWSPQN